MCVPRAAVLVSSLCPPAALKHVSQAEETIGLAMVLQCPFTFLLSPTPENNVNSRATRVNLIVLPPIVGDLVKLPPTFHLMSRCVVKLVCLIIPMLKYMQHSRIVSN